MNVDKEYRALPSSRVRTQLGSPTEVSNFLFGVRLGCPRDIDTVGRYYFNFLTILFGYRIGVVTSESYKDSEYDHGDSPPHEN